MLENQITERVWGEDYEVICLVIECIWFSARTYMRNIQ